MLIILSHLYDLYGRFTHDHHGHTASVFQNIHRIICFLLFQLDTLLDTHYRKFAYAQAIALSPYPYFFQSLYLPSPVVSAQGRPLFLQCNIVPFLFSCNCNWVHSGSCFFFFFTKNETGKAPKIKDGGFFFSSFFLSLNNRRTRRFKGWKKLSGKWQGDWGTFTGTRGTNCAIHKMIRNLPKTTVCMYKHACGRELDKYPSKLRLGMT